MSSGDALPHEGLGVQLDTRPTCFPFPAVVRELGAWQYELTIVVDMGGVPGGDVWMMHRVLGEAMDLIQGRINLAKAS